VIQDNFNVNEVATYFAVNMVLSHWDGSSQLLPLPRHEEREVGALSVGSGQNVGVLRWDPR